MGHARSKGRGFRGGLPRGGRAARSHRPNELELPENLEAAVASGHPWIYKNHVPPSFEADDGAWVRVHAGRVSAWGLWDRESSIALRLYSWDRQPDLAWVIERVERAWQLRRSMLPEDTTAFRWIYGEGDGLPGIVVDYYAGWVVIVTYASSTESVLEWLTTALEQREGVRGILHRCSQRSSSEAEGSLRLLWGEPPPPDLVVTERGIRLAVDLEAGQKTGLYLDHRDNRQSLMPLYRGRRVLNLYSYTGAFSLGAARAGATQVVSVDQAEPAILSARRNFVLNDLDPSPHEFVVADVFDHLKSRVAAGDRFDIVICDPPSLARRSSQREGALKAYQQLAELCLRVVSKAGYLAFASCTAQVSPESFRELLARAAGKTRRWVQIVNEAGHAADHPILAVHREGRYLKFILARVFERD